ncbi:enoyl-CoA hydratase-related protein [Rhodococcus sp. HNM0569]|uniref:enoyl-CoA hydratase/isomerase family protein n=1 Tax=Rhodococcus sp. HNM0569 TaxID=2716340 RepID=UPI00197CB58C|nr:enoyl-CoA hydratase-related protein [Rhodococcus sp. HNM0569]
MNTTTFSGQIFPRRGLSVDFGGSWILPRLIGLHRAKRLVMLGEMLGTDDVDQLGLVSHVAAPGAALSTALELAHRLADGPTLAITQSARLLERGVTRTLAEALDDEARVQAVNFATDAPAAVAAFRDKTAPTFTGDWQVPQADSGEPVR